jgi:hypothetical protein
MDDLSNAVSRTYGYLLLEEGHTKLQEIRDQLFLLASVTFASTLEEENAALEVRRSMLGQCFENFGLQIDEVLDGVKLPERVRHGSRREH